MRKHFITKATPRRTALVLLAVLMVILSAGCEPVANTGDSASPAPTAQNTPDVLPSGGPAPTADPTAALEPFSPGITATTLGIIDDTRQYPAGQDWEDNLWTRAYKEKLGVSFEYVWKGAAQELKAQLDELAAAGRLPDYMVLDYDLFYALAERGLLEPLDHSAAVYASTQVRTALDAYDSAALKTASLGGDLYGITAAPPRDGLMLWYRDDWFAKTGRTQAPATIEEVIELAYEFAAQGEGRQGFALDKALFVGDNASTVGLEGIFSAYGVYPTQWQEIDGELIHGSVNPEVKQVLTLLQKCYADGLIASDFRLMDPWVDTPLAIEEDRVGLVFAPEWFSEKYAGIAMAKHEDKGITWTSMPIPGSSGATNRLPTKARQGAVTSIRAGYAYPELAIKMVNLTQSLLFGDMADSQYRLVVEDKNYIDTSFMAMAAGGHLTDGVGKSDGQMASVANSVLSALASTQESTLSGDAKLVYDRVKAWQDGAESATANDYVYYATFGPNGSQAVLADMRARGLLMPDAYYGPQTTIMQDSMGTLMQKRNEIYSRIIAGDGVDIAFNAYVEFFEENGGREITRQVNNWFAQN